MAPASGDPPFGGLGTPEGKGQEGKSEGGVTLRPSYLWLKTNGGKKDALKLQTSDV